MCFGELGAEAEFIKVAFFSKNKAPVFVSINDRSDPR